jgi:hypothetical protein
VISIPIFFCIVVGDIFTRQRTSDDNRQELSMLSNDEHVALVLPSMVNDLADEIRQESSVIETHVAHMSSEHDRLQILSINEQIEFDTNIKHDENELKPTMFETSTDGSLSARTSIIMNSLVQHAENIEPLKEILSRKFIEQQVETNDESPSTRSSSVMNIVEQQAAYTDEFKQRMFDRDMNIVETTSNIDEHDSIPSMNISHQLSTTTHEQQLTRFIDM